jgi:methionyl aminopeptidase
MKLNIKNPFGASEVINLKGSDWLDKQRVAGKIVSAALSLLENEVKNSTQLSLLELNELAESLIYDSKAIPTFKGYKGFPCGVCISVNKQLVHGIPTDYKLQDGDVVSFDLGATYEGAIADSALTCIYGAAKSEQHKLLLKVTEESLMEGIKAIKVGNRLGCIGHAINKHLKKYGFGVIHNYGGHGICINPTTNEGIPHAPPFVSNKSDINSGIRIQSGLVIAIEPMAVIGDTFTFVATDNWTVCGMGISAHYEHSVYVHNDHVEIITAR